MHRKGLADAARELLVRGIAMLGQCLGELGGERVAQQDEVIEALGRGPRRRKMIGGDVEVQEAQGDWNCTPRSFDGALTYSVPAGMVPSEMI